MGTIAIEDAERIAEVVSNQIGDYLLPRIDAEIRRMIEENQGQPVDEACLRAWLVAADLANQESAENLVIFDEGPMPML